MHPDQLLGELVRRGKHVVEESDKGAWIEEIAILRRQLDGIDGFLHLEFTIPRLGGRIDAVVLAGPLVFVIEFKVGESSFNQAAINQVWDYALDLKYFHEASHAREIVPVLVATAAKSSRERSTRVGKDGVHRPLKLAPGDLGEVTKAALSAARGAPIDPRAWAESPYRPTPSIIEAARALYATHSVEAIARFDSGAQNLATTSACVEQVIAAAREKKRKVICFVTGVPGAGKTLVGLNVATRREEASGAPPSVYLSGNGPLVSVLREALARDEVARRKAIGEDVKKRDARRGVDSFIQNVHHFRDEGLRNNAAPPEHVAVFDEAQRAWDLAQTSRFMQQKKGVGNFRKTEPEFLVSVMDRHRDWAVVVCLVGGGQEINTGEMGIEGWLHAARTQLAGWDVIGPPQLQYALPGNAAAAWQLDPRLHLDVSMRSFRAGRVSAFVEALLACDIDKAGEALETFKEQYPIAVTRDLDAAREWLRQRTRGSERCGIVASSRAQRLKPHALDVRISIDPIHWFLNGPDDTRSSNFLEDAATEYKVQGLEIDWACVTWDADLRRVDGGWARHAFRGDRWNNINKPEIQRYLLNAYRVLLTRARQGMILFVPPGDRHDHTRKAEFYDGTYRTLRDIGIPALD